jgi:type VI secretion system protein ImpA
MRDEFLKLLEPIEGPNPAGSYLRDEPGDDGLTVYDKIKKARTEEVDSLTGDRTSPDSALVEKIAAAALATQSKDIQIAAWLTEALIKRDGIAGLRDGLDLLKGLLEQFWDHVHPELEDGDAEMRAMPLNWVGDYLDIPVKFAPLNNKGHGYFEYQEAISIGDEAEASADPAKRSARAEAIEAGKPTLEEFDKGYQATAKPWYKQLVADIESSIATLEELDKFGAEKFGSDAPSYTKLQNALSDVQGVAAQLLAKKLEIDPDPVEPEPAESDPAVASTAATSDAQGLSAEPTSSGDAAAHIAAAARFLQREDPTNPAPYLMLRGYRWGELRALGGDVDPRALAAPPTNTRTRLKGLLLDEKWPELLAAGESVMATQHGRGWLDLQRYVSTALEALGSEYEYVASAIRGALVELLRDLPELPQLTMMDDTPTANAETRGWLRELLATSPTAGEQPVAIPDDEEFEIAPAGSPRAARSGSDRAVALAKSGQHQKAIQLLMSLSEQEKCARDKFLRRTEAADIMVNNGHEAVALPILRELTGLVDTHSLESWEAGDTVARPLSLLHRCLRALDPDSESAQEELYRRICRLDPLKAISFSGDKAGPTDAPAEQPYTAPAPAAKPADSEPEADDSSGAVDATALLNQMGNS